MTAQGLGVRRPSKPGPSHLRSVARRVHALQLDSVSAVVRAHYLPAYSRIGPYPRAALDRLVNVRHDLIETNAHQASLVPVEYEPLLRWRGPRARTHAGDRLERARPGYIDAVREFVAERGPVALSDLPDPGRRFKPRPEDLPVRRRDGRPYAESSMLWARASDGKAALDWLVATGRIALAGRRGFDRLYDLPERVIPEHIREQPTPDEPEAKRALVDLAGRALGVATLADIAGYFELKSADTKVAVRDLVEEGTLTPVSVEGWRDPAYLHVAAKAPRRIDARTLLSPFDSLTWSRSRTARLFGFAFSFEIYVPEPKRRFGYYVLPLLLGEELAARVDLRADRKASVLRVPGAYAEDGWDLGEIAPALAAELHDMAAWLGLDELHVGERGDLAAPLRAAVREWRPERVP